MAHNDLITEGPDERAAILVVDDGYADRLMLSEILSGPKQRVDAVGSGQEALKCLLNHEYAVIVLDVLMPTMDGFELASTIKQRERTRYTPIIFLTAAGDDIGKLYRAYALGAVDYLQKPIDPDIMRAKVGIFIDLAQKDAQLRRHALATQVTERRERELQLAELKLSVRQRYVNLAEAIPQIVWTSDPSGELDYTNRRWEEYTGLDLVQSRGTGWLSAIHPTDAGRCIEAWQEALKTNGTFEIECRLRRAADATYRWHLCRAVPEFDGNAQLVAWLGTFTDFEELRQAVSARDEFISIASHELRTPLTALKLRLEAMSLEGGLPDRVKQRLENALRQTNRLERLVEDLLDISRITTDQLELNVERLDLLEVVTEVVDRLHTDANRHGSQLVLAQSVAVSGYWDRIRLDQVVTNLLSNAIRYGNGHDILVQIEADDAVARLVVKDGGIGISEQDIERIFKLFERGTNRRTQGGLGMGLYIANRIVRAHGGTIDVSSRLGVGTEFKVTLPRGVPSEE